tara:strand:+ start:45 stop:275 length:231 start_codon:yes stop_codon:yes gene_type:complete
METSLKELIKDYLDKNPPQQYFPEVGKVVNLRKFTDDVNLIDPSWVASGLQCKFRTHKDATIGFCKEAYIEWWNEQ